MAKPRAAAAQRIGRGATKIFPVEKLFRRAGGRRRDDPVVGSEGGRRAGNQGRRKISQQEGWRRASEARDRTHREFVHGAHYDENGKRLHPKLVHKNLRNKVVTGCH